MLKATAQIFAPQGRYKAGLLDADVLLARVPVLPVAVHMCDHIEMMLRSIISAIA